MSGPGLTIDPAIFERYPGTLVGTVVAHGIDNRTGSPALVEGLRTAAAEARKALAGIPIVEHPRIAPWREAYRGFGAKPKKYPSSIEALCRRVARGDELPSINPLVDLYNAVSLRHLLPVGGEDLDRLEGRLTLRFAGDSEPEVSLLGRPEPAAPDPGEVIYADDAGVVCRRWNWREAARTCLSEDTRNAILVVELLPPTDPSVLDETLAELAATLERHCGGDLEVSVFGGG